MEFCVLEEEEFRAYLNQHPLKTFLQTPEIAHLREKSGWKKHYVGVKEHEKIVAASMMLSKQTHFGKCVFYALRGFLIDYEDVDLLAFFTKEVKKYVKRHHGYCLRMDPYYPLVERDTDGRRVEEGFDHRPLLKVFSKLGYVRVSKPEQVEWMYVLDLDVTSDQLWQRMRTVTKRNILKAKKNGIVLREASKEEIPIVAKVIDSTSERKQFSGRTLSYYQNLYEVFAPRGEIRFMIGELHLSDYISKLEAELEDEKQILSDLELQQAKQKKKQRHMENIDHLTSSLEEAKRIFEKEGETLVLSGGVFLLYGDELLYLFGGNYKEYMKFGASYLMQWEMINYGIEHGYRRYNFYGISGTFDKKDSYYGVYDFKRGFTGYVEQLIGEFVLPVDTFFYHLFYFLHKIKKK